MPSPAKLTAGLLLLIILVGTIGFASLSTTYHPHGLDPLKRPAYYEKVEWVKRRSEMAEAIDSKVPRLHLSHKEFDFGLMDPESSQTHDFGVTNHGKGPLTIAVQETTCKCTVGEAVSNLLLPGESSFIQMRWNTGQQEDQYEQTALVRTNDPFAEEVRLTVRGTVRTKLAFDDVAMNFAAMDYGVPKEARLTLYSQLYRDLAIVSVDGGPPGMAWETQPAEIADKPILIEKEAISAIQLVAQTSSKSKGRFTGTMQVHVLLENGQEQIIDLPYTGRVRSPVSFYSPNIHQQEGLNFGIVEQGDQVKQSVIVRLRTATSHPIEVLDVYPEFLETTLTPLDAFNARLTITVPKNAPEEMFHLESHRGYVHVGDRCDEVITNWFPIYGAVVRSR